jgi:hypothetical protein
MNEKESRRDDDGPFCLDSWLRQSGKRRYGYGKIAPKPKKLITKLKKMSLLKLSVLPLAGALARNHLVSSIQTPLIFNTCD